MQRCDINTQHCLQIPTEAIAAFRSTNKAPLWNQQFLREAPVPSLEAAEEQALQEQWAELLLWRYKPARRWDIAFACALQTLKETPALSLMVHHCPASEHSEKYSQGCVKVLTIMFQHVTCTAKSDWAEGEWISLRASPVPKGCLCQIISTCHRHSGRPSFILLTAGIHKPLRGF